MTKVINIDDDVRFKDPFNDLEKYKAWFVRQDYLHQMILWLSQNGYTFTSKDGNYLEVLEDYIHPIEDSELRYVWVFGSNLKGIHGKGAALSAKRHHTATTGLGEGVSIGQFCSYALPTKDRTIRTLSTQAIQQHVESFLVEVVTHPNWIFTVTRVGCGLAGLLDTTMVELFKEAFKVLKIDNIPPNLDLPADWVKLMDYKGEVVAGYKLNEVSANLLPTDLDVSLLISTSHSDPMEREAIDKGIDFIRIPIYPERYSETYAVNEQMQELLRRSTIVLSSIGDRVVALVSSQVSSIVSINRGR